jgi:predicted nucleic acid-binding protein
MTREEYLLASRSLDDVGVVIHPTGPDSLQRPAALAADWNLRFFDAVMVERALQRGLILLTTDLKLCNAVSGKVPTELLGGIR